MRKFIRIACVVVFVYSAIQLMKYGYSYIDSEKTLEHVQQQVAEQEIIQTPEPQQVSKIDSLRAMNERIVGWIDIDNTQINNPILQAADNDFYLHHNHLDDKSRAGSIFMDYRNDPEQLGRHTILYGHVMRNGTMFGELHRFAEQSFADENGKFTIELMGNVYEVDVFSAYETTTDFYYIETNFASDATFETFIASLQSRSIIATTVTVMTEDQLITLSTCTTSPNDKERFVVHGKIKKLG